MFKLKTIFLRENVLLLFLNRLQKMYISDIDKL